MIQTLGALYYLSPVLTNYGMVNLPNLYNLLISILSLSLCPEVKKEIVQLIKLHLGITIFTGLKQYALKKYSGTHPIIQTLEE